MLRRFYAALLTIAACSAFAACTASTAASDSLDLITAAQAYTPHPGETWTFLNGYGDTTTVVTEIAPDPVACRSGPNTIWHYRKSNPRAYWNPGIPGAELLFVLHQNPDSSWRSTASVISFPQSTDWTTATWDILDNPPDVALPYEITPPTLRRGDHLVRETLADAIGGTGIHTLDCVVPDGQLVALAGHGEEWRTEYYLENVVTPIYSGLAAVSEQWENCNATHTNVGCGHEKWWFAPDRGLVKVQQFNSGSGVDNDLDPKLVMERVR